MIDWALFLDVIAIEVITIAILWRLMEWKEIGLFSLLVVVAIAWLIAS